MFAAHPLLGVGPDNFRLTYPRYRRTHGRRSAHAQQQHTSKWLAGGGLVTALAFGLVRLERRPNVPRRSGSG